MEQGANGMSSIIKTGQYATHSKIKGRYVQLAIDDELVKILDWCLDTFGIDSRDTWWYSRKDHILYFTKEDDTLMFMLRWS